MSMHNSYPKFLPPIFFTEEIRNEIVNDIRKSGGIVEVDNIMRDRIYKEIMFNLGEHLEVKQELVHNALLKECDLMTLHIDKKREMLRRSNDFKCVKPTKEDKEKDDIMIKEMNKQRLLFIKAVNDDLIFLKQQEKEQKEREIKAGQETLTSPAETTKNKQYTTQMQVNTSSMEITDGQIPGFLPSFSTILESQNNSTNDQDFKTFQNSIEQENFDNLIDQGHLMLSMPLLKKCYCNKCGKEISG